MNTSSKCFKSGLTPVTVLKMSHPDVRVDQPDQSDIQAVALLHVDDVPARRLLAHDMEHTVWDDDGDSIVPPPY